MHSNDKSNDNCKTNGSKSAKNESEVYSAIEANILSVTRDVVIKSAVQLSNEDYTILSRALQSRSIPSLVNAIMACSELKNAFISALLIRLADDVSSLRARSGSYVSIIRTFKFCLLWNYTYSTKTCFYCFHLVSLLLYSGICSNEEDHSRC